MSIQYICGTCGTIAMDEDRDKCLQGHDDWIEKRDFENSQLEIYIQEACDNLNMTREELESKFD